MACNCSKSKRDISYIVKYESGEQDKHTSLRAAQDALRASGTKGRISKVRA